VENRDSRVSRRAISRDHPNLGLSHGRPRQSGSPGLKESAAIHTIPPRQNQGSIPTSPRSTPALTAAVVASDFRYGTRRRAAPCDAAYLFPVSWLDWLGGTAATRKPGKSYRSCGSSLSTAADGVSDPGGIAIDGCSTIDAIAQRAGRCYALVLVALPSATICPAAHAVPQYSIYRWDGAGQTEPVIWDGDTIEPLRPVPGSSSAGADDLNDGPGG